MKLIDEMNHARQIIRAAADYYGATTGAIMAKGRDAWVVKARHVAIYLIRKRLGWSYPMIGAYFGRDHSTVMYAYRKVEAYRDRSLPAYDQATATAVDLIIEWLGP